MIRNIYLAKQHMYIQLGQRYRSSVFTEYTIKYKNMRCSIIQLSELGRRGKQKWSCFEIAAKWIRTSIVSLVFYHRDATLQFPTTWLQGKLKKLC